MKIQTIGIFILLTLLNLLIGTGYCLVNSLDDYYLKYVIISELILIPVSVLISFIIDRKH
jgi:hypothetical protein